MQKAAFVDHAFKQKTGSSEFFRKILREYFNVDTYWDHSFRGGPRFDMRAIADGSYDVVIFFQMVNVSPYDLYRLNCPNIVFVPMYDHSRDLPDQHWLWYKGCKFINFSQALHRRHRSLGLNSLYVQYFPEPVEQGSSKNDKGLRGFFWYRTPEISWPLVRELIGDSSFSGLHIHVTEKWRKTCAPAEEEIRKYRIAFSDWYKDKDEYLAALSSSDVFFASRRHEGIGMSFLEAMTRGKCVVAPDSPTMNEYIVHGQNGLLYDPDNPVPPDLTTAYELGRQAAETIKKGHANWRESESNIIGFILEEMPGQGDQLRKKPGAKMRIVAWYFQQKKFIERKFPQLSKLFIRIFRGKRK